MNRPTGPGIMAGGHGGPRSALRILLAMKRSVIACLVALALGLASMGALGAGLYYAAYPALAPWFGDMRDWSGDWVWPATIMAGMLWSAGFLVAGLLDLCMERHAWCPALRRAAYFAVLWLAAAGIWAALLSGAGA